MLPADSQHAISLLRALCRKTSALILPFYQQEQLSITQKDNNTPLTQADLAAHHCLKQTLPTIIAAPVVSEEDEQPQALCQPLYWLIDPIDGTKSFIEKTGQFCICIALIADQRPVLSMIYAPLTHQYWYALAGQGSFHACGDETPKRLFCRPQQAPLTLTSAAHSHKLSHRMRTLSAVLYGDDFRHLSLQSALKFCSIAEARADLYLKPTCLSNEWDIAAGDLLLCEAGGALYYLDTQSALLYTPRYGIRETLSNPPFIACGAGFTPEQLQKIADKMFTLMTL